MIVYLTGTLIDQLPSGELIILVNGVGYAVNMPELDRQRLPGFGERVEVFTHLLIRETEHQLFGFLTRESRRWFQHLIKLNGVGPKLALTILSAVSVRELINIVATGNLRQLQTIPGIGKRTAERLLLELKRLLDGNEMKLGLQASQGNGPLQQHSHAPEETVSAALSQLGYKSAEVRQLLTLAMSNTSYPSAEALLKATLQLAHTGADPGDIKHGGGDHSDA